MPRGRPVKRIKANKDMLVSLGIETPLLNLQRRRGRKRSPAAFVDAIAQLSLPTTSTHSYPLSEADGQREPESESVTPRHTGTGTPVAAETDKLSCSVDTEETRQNAMGCGGQGSDWTADMMVSAVESAGSTERLVSKKELGLLPRITHFLTAKPRVGCQRSQDASRQQTGDEVSMGVMTSSGSSVKLIDGVSRGDL